MTQPEYLLTLNGADSMAEADEIGAEIQELGQVIDELGATGVAAQQRQALIRRREMLQRRQNAIRTAVQNTVGFAGQNLSAARRNLATVTSRLSCSWIKTGAVGAGMNTGLVFGGAGMGGSLPLVTFSTSAAGDQFMAWPQQQSGNQLYKSNIVLDPSRGKVQDNIVISGMSYVLEAYGPSFLALGPDALQEQLRQFATLSTLTWYVNRNQPGVQAYLHEIPSPLVPQLDAAVAAGFTAAGPPPTAPIVIRSPDRNGAGGSEFYRYQSPISISPNTDAILILGNVPVYAGTIAAIANGVLVPGDFFRFSVEFHGAGIQRNTPRP